MKYKSATNNRQRSLKNAEREVFIMDLKTLLGDAYREGMTIEEINEALAGKELVDKSVLSNYVPKAVFDKTASEAAEYKKKLRATMTEAEQKAQEEKERQEAIENELKALRRKAAVADFEKQYLGLGYDPETATKIAEATYDNDMDTVFDLQKKFIDSKEKAIKAEILKNTPSAVSGNQVKVDYSKQIEAAKAEGNMALAISLMRQQAEANSNKE